MRQAEPDSNGAFDIRGHVGIPGLAIAFDQAAAQPVLFSIVPNPRDGLPLDLNLHTTALCLVFMTPYVITQNPEDASTTLARINALPEFDDFEKHLEKRMNNSADALLDDDTTTDSLYTRVVSAFIPAHTPDKSSPPKSAVSKHNGAVQIDPSYEKGGLKVRYEGADKFMITNSLGRWAYTVMPESRFFVSPIGDLIDILRGKAPFSPSTTPFELKVELGDDPDSVNVYGFGWSPDEDNIWENLTPAEQDWARTGGMMTVVAEFIPAALSVVVNVRAQFPYTDQSMDEAIDILNMIYNNQALAIKLGERIREGGPWGISWLIFKAFLAQLAKDRAFQIKVAKFMGFVLPESLTKNLPALAAPPIKLVNSLDAAAAVGKTLPGFRNGRFKTTFKIWREATNPYDLAILRAAFTRNQPVCRLQVPLSCSKGTTAIPWVPGSKT